jgi:hypothetical protein
VILAREDLSYARSGMRTSENAYLLGTRVNKDKKQEGRSVVPAMALPYAAGSLLRDPQTVAVGFMFWFTRKRLVGSYSFFIATNLS